MKVLALFALFGCGAIQRHPFASTAAANSALVVAAGVCAVECDGNARGASEAVLVGELALSSLAAVWAIEFFVAYGEGSGR